MNSLAKLGVDLNRKKGKNGKKTKIHYIRDRYYPFNRGINSRHNKRKCLSG
jgi:hypothetical protein